MCIYWKTILAGESLKNMGMYLVASIEGLGEETNLLKIIFFQLF